MVRAGLANEDDDAAADEPAEDEIALEAALGFEVREKRKKNRDDQAPPRAKAEGEVNDGRDEGEGDEGLLREEDVDAWAEDHEDQEEEEQAEPGEHTGPEQLAEGVEDVIRLCQTCPATSREIA